MARVLTSLKLPHDLLENLRARARDSNTSVTRLIEQGAAHVLAQPAQPVEPKAAAPKPVKPAPKPKPADVTAARAATAQSMADAARQQAKPVEAECGKCSHPKSAHWGRGCYAGCNCNERMYRERVVA